jgi:hypothetical protein
VFDRFGIKELLKRCYVEQDRQKLFIKKASPFWVQIKIASYSVNLFKKIKEEEHHAP